VGILVGRLRRHSRVGTLTRTASAIGLMIALAACGRDEPAFRGVEVPTCPERMVLVPGGHTCMDTHEALIEERRAVPAIASPAIDHITWYEAERACRASGFRLCSVDEFERACAGADRSREYPYGPEHVPGRCNVAEIGDDLATRSVRASGAFPECRTPEGIFDLSGNVSEWLSDEGGGGGLMAGLGGNAFQPSGTARCMPNERGWLAPDQQGGGFRCCVTLGHDGSAPAPSPSDSTSPAPRPSHGASAG
jgi:hypothetical protein